MPIGGPAAAEEYDSLTWWYDLDEPFIAHAEFLDSKHRYATKLAADGVTYEASVLLPRLPVEVGGAAAYLKPPSDWPAGSSEDRRDWGIDYRNSALGLVGVVVKRLAFFGTLPPEEVAAPHLRGEWGLDLFGTDVRVEMDTWWDNVRTWLEISTGQRLTQVGAKQRTYDTHDRMQIWLASSASTNRKVWAGGGREISDIPIVHSVDDDTFAACTALSNVEPHIAWTLLRDARALQGVRQYRRAAIDAATAAELAIGEILDGRLKHVETRVRQALLGKNPMLGSKTGLLNKLGQPLPKSFMERLVTKRNKAVHTGADPTAEECEGAIQEALVQVQTVFPLPFPPGADSPLVCRW